MNLIEALLPILAVCCGILVICYPTMLTIRQVRLCQFEMRFRREFQAGNYSAALEMINRALKIDPGAAQLYYSRARVYYELGDYFAAEADYNQGMRFMQSATAYAGRAAARRRLGKTGTALIDANHAIACSRLWWRGYYERGRVYNVLGHYEVALDDFQQAFELTRKPPAELYLARAEAYRRLDQIEEARRDYEQALKLDPALRDKFRDEQAFLLSDAI